jgi:F-type H+-transporting ATPase subunit epsilon
MNSFCLEIVAPDGVVLSEPVDLLVARSHEGEFGVMANHAPMLAAVRAGVIHIVQGERTRWFAMVGGILNVSHDDCRLLTDWAREAPSIKAAEEIIAKLQGIMEDVDADREDRQPSQMT